MKYKDAIEILKNMKSYYNDQEHDKYYGFDLDDNEAVDKAIKLLKEKEKGYMCQQIERNIQYEILADAEKARAFAQLTVSIQNFINAIGGIDIQVVIQTRREGD